MGHNITARCASCRFDVPVPDSHADGAQIGCPRCSSHLRVVRTGGLRLVIADALALRETLRQLKVGIEQTRAELQTARASWGIGVNGFGLGLLYVIARVFLERREINRGLIVEALALSVLVGVLLELTNTLFLAKRQAIVRLTDQLRMATAEQKELERQIRESTRR